MTFDQDFARLAYNVTAVPQSDPNGFGPGYLLNGLSNGGFWYQVGLAYNWPYQAGGYDSGFNFIYEAFNSSGGSVFPSGGGGGLGSFSGPVYGGDLVLLQLSFSGGQVLFTAHDWSTGVTATQSYPAFGSRFVGLPSSSGANGFFSGLMTEWYHVNVYYGSEAEVTYSDPSVRLGSATLWVDEFNSNSSASLFEDSRGYTFSDPGQLKLFSLLGATEYADAYTFITGSRGKVPITLSYSVYGGGTAYGAPQLSYISNGTTQTTLLSPSPTTYLADNGSRWQVSSSLPGGSLSERWETSQPTNGTLAGPITDAILYFHQYLASFAYAVKGGGSGYAPPKGNASEFGTALVLDGNVSAWVDAGAPFSYPTTLQGSTRSERWATLNSSWSLDGPERVVVTYFHQFALGVRYDIVGGGSPGGPSLSGTRFGSSVDVSVSNSTLHFLDEGSSWSFSPLLPGSSAQERWNSRGGANGTASGPRNVTVTYYHQFAVTAVPNPGAGGSASVQSPWAVAGSGVQLAATPEPGWRFAEWQGLGNGSYSGSFAGAIVTVYGPVSENATFYPGLEIRAGSNGAVAYTSAFGNGTVPAGGATVVFVPSGMKVTLHAAPSVLYAFSGWDPSSGGGPTIYLTITSPESVRANFTLDPLALAGVVALLVAVMGAGVFLATRRRGPRLPSPTL